MDNIELLEIFNIVNDLGKKKKKALMKNEQYLSEEINRFRVNGGEKPQLHVINGYLKDAKSSFKRNETITKKKLELLPLFELFVKCVLSEIEDFKQSIEVIEYNLENMIRYINTDVNNDFVFSLDEVSPNNLSEITRRIDRVEGLINERNQMVKRVIGDI